jgi:hypothetical protein
MDLNNLEELKKKAFIQNLEEQDILETYPETYFSDFNIVGARITVKLFVNPKNLSENTTLTPTLAQCYIDTTDFGGRLLLELQTADVIKPISVKLVLMKTGIYDIVKASISFKNFLSYFFLKRNVFKRKVRKIKKGGKLHFKRKSFVHVSELLNGICKHKKNAWGLVYTYNDFKVYFSTLRTIKTYLIK